MIQLALLKPKVKIYFWICKKSIFQGKLAGFHVAASRPLYKFAKSPGCDILANKIFDMLIFFAIFRDYKAVLRHPHH